MLNEEMRIGLTFDDVLPLSLSFNRIPDRLTVTNEIIISHIAHSIQWELPLSEMS
jgi:hypothetical protein